MKVFRSTLPTLVLVVFLALPAGAQDPAAAGPCAQPEASQFDFWLGEWEVFAKGNLVGRNTISRIHGGCTLFEDYSAAGGKFAGRSFNYYDPADGRWHQVWVDNSGTRLHLAGGFGDGRMELTGERRVAAGLVTDRIIWTDNDDGTVGQLWELSEDGGETWQVLFDGLYRRAEPGDPERNH